MARLLTIEQAAEELGVPSGSLKSAARQHGLLVKMGRAIRVDLNDLPRLIKLCQEKQREPASIKDAVSTTSETEPKRSQRVLKTAAKLKGRYQDT